MNPLQKRSVITAFATALAALVGLAAYLYVSTDAATEPQAKTTEIAQSTTTADNSASVATDDTASQLTFLIEEEKLAHDIYTKMYEKWGAKVFGNILESEATHQDRVLGLLQSRSIADPRKNEVGQFTDKDLQALYDQLLAKGLASEQGAYEVGVAIEEKDIADIGEILGKVSDGDVVSALEDLRRGSENHLRAFNRQL